MLPDTLRWNDKTKQLEILDQRRLPREVSYLRCSTVEDVARAIETMAVRGAPAIGIAAAYGVVLTKPMTHDALKESLSRLARTRPTAVNLFWALNRMEKVAESTKEALLGERLLTEARQIHFEDIEINRRIGINGAKLLPDTSIVITHCNAGALATGGYGTALGIIRAAKEQGKNIKVYVDETRPVLQGARLTAWELFQDGVDVTLICDSMAPFVMKKEKIHGVIVGADRVARNGDVANKIGTYGLAVAAKYHGVPFIVAAPVSTIDPACLEGDKIPIEIRKAEEIRKLPGGMEVPEEIPVWNPAFDVTPKELVTAIVTERGVLYPPFEEAIARLFA